LDFYASLLAINKVPLEHSSSGATQKLKLEHHNNNESAGRAAAWIRQDTQKWDRRESRNAEEETENQ
jgi:hypothetical protein